MTGPEENQLRRLSASLRRAARSRWGVGILVGAIGLVILRCAPLEGFPVSPDEARWVATGGFFSHKFFVERDFGAETWEARGFQRYGTRNPPVGKYLFGASLALSGLGDRYTERDEVLRLWRRGGGLPLEASPEVVSGRRVGWVAILLSGLLIFALATRLLGSPAIAALAALLFYADPTVLSQGRRAMTDVPALFFCLGSLQLTLRLVDAARSGRRGRANLWGGALGAAIGLGVGTKLNAALIVPVCIAWALVELAAPRRAMPAVGTPTVAAWRNVLVGAAIAAVTAAVLWLALNPFLWRDPIGNTRQLLAYGEELRDFAARRDASDILYRPVASRLHAAALVARHAARGPLDRWLGLPRGDAALLVLGAVGCACLLRSRATRPEVRRGVALLSIWLAVTALGTSLWIPFDWDRYYLPIIPCWAILAASCAAAFAPPFGRLKGGEVQSSESVAGAAGARAESPPVPERVAR